MSKKNIDVLAIRSIRKASHISKKLSQKTYGLMERVEDKSTRIIIEKTGSFDGGSSTNVTDYIYKHYPYIFPVHPALPEIGQKPSVTVFAFLNPKGFYGGIATLLITAGELANKLGYDLRVAQTTGFSDKTDVLSFLASNGIKISEERFSTLDLSKRNASNFGYLPLHQDDVVLVSAWWDAHVAAQLPLKKKFVYLIQDYEPIFYNNGDSAVLADQTYHTGKFVPLLNTKILYTFFKERKYEYITKNGTWFEPAPAPDIREKGTNGTDTKRLFLYGRPAVHRNLFYTALQALDIAFASGKISGTWELFCAGQSDIPNLRLSTGHIIKNLGKMDIADYYTFANTVDVAVSPMLAPHPNYPTLEFAHLGAAVVSTKWETKQDLSTYSPNILMAEPNAIDLSDAIIKAANTPYKDLLENTKRNHINSNWVESLDGPLSKLVTKL